MAWKMEPTGFTSEMTQKTAQRAKIPPRQVGIRSIDDIRDNG